MNPVISSNSSFTHELKKIIVQQILSTNPSISCIHSSHSHPWPILSLQLNFACMPLECWRKQQLSKGSQTNNGVAATLLHMCNSCIVKYYTFSAFQPVCHMCYSSFIWTSVLCLKKCVLLLRIVISGTSSTSLVTWRRLTPSQECHFLCIFMKHSNICGSNNQLIKNI